MNEEEKKEEFETKMCELIRNCTFRITEAKVLTFYAQSYYILLLDMEMPVAIVEYFVHPKTNNVWLHDYKTMERGICTDMVVELEKLEQELTNLWKEIKGEEHENN